MGVGRKLSELEKSVRQIETLLQRSAEARDLAGSGFIAINIERDNIAVAQHDARISDQIFHPGAECGLLIIGYERAHRLPLSDVGQRPQQILLVAVMLPNGGVKLVVQRDEQRRLLQDTGTISTGNDVDRFEQLTRQEPMSRILVNIGMRFDRRDKGISKVFFARRSHVAVDLDVAAFEWTQGGEEKDRVVACPIGERVTQGHGLSQGYAGEQRLFGQSYCIECLQEQTV